MARRSWCSSESMPLAATRASMPFAASIAAIRRTVPFMRDGFRRKVVQRTRAGAPRHRRRMRRARGPPAGRTDCPVRRRVAMSGSGAEGRALADITELIGKARDGDAQASERLFAALYDDLHRVAAGQLRGEDVMRSTSLVHEAWLKLANHGAIAVNDRAHYFA